MKQRNIDQLRFRQLSAQDLDQHIHNHQLYLSFLTNKMRARNKRVRYFAVKAGDTADKLILLKEEKGRREQETAQ
nr:MAG TPA: hypothetical protein [Caudoviricetes sp.]